MYRALTIILGAALIIGVSLALATPAGAVDPICDITGPATAGVNEVLEYDASGSSDPDGTIVSYDWTYTGGTRAQWTQQYEGSMDPTLYGWECESTCGTDVRAIEIDPTDTGLLCDVTSNNCAWNIVDSSSSKNKYRRDLATTTIGATVTQRVRFVDSPGENNAIIARLGTGFYRVELYAQNDPDDPLGENMRVHNYRVEAGEDEFFGAGAFKKDEWHVWRATCDSTGNFAVYLDENPTPLKTGTANGNQEPTYQFGAANTGNTATLDVDYWRGSVDGVFLPGFELENPAKLYVRFPGEGTYEVCVTVTDNEGFTATCCTSTDIINQPPTCSITYSPADPSVGQTVTFNANAIDPEGQPIVSIGWDFGDGGTATGDPATHAYVAGNQSYTVTCTPTDSDGATGSCTTTVTVNAIPVCAIEVTTPEPLRTCSEICFDGSGSSDVDGTIVSYTWDFGDTPPAPSTFQNGDFEAGVEPWHLSPEDWDGGQFTEPWERFYYGSVYGYVCGKFTDGMVASGWVWQEVTDLQVGSIYRLCALVYLTDDETANLDDWMNVGVDLDCTATDSTGVDVWGPNPVTRDGMGSITQVCVNFLATSPCARVFVAANTGGGQGWRRVATDSVTLVGYSEITTAEPTICHVYQTPGSYTVELTVTDDLGAASTCSTTITVVEGICCSIGYDPTEVHICDTVTFTASATGGTAPYSYDWDFGDGGTGTGNPATHEYIATGLYQVTCVVTDDLGVTGSCLAVVRVGGALPVCVISGPSQVRPNTAACWTGDQSYDPDACGGCGSACPGLGIVSYAWDFGAVGTNLVTNPGFEEGFTLDGDGDEVANGWTKFESAASALFLLYDETVNMHTGAHAQTVYWNEQAGTAQAGVYQVISGLTSGNLYDISMWLRCSTTGANPADVVAEAGYDLAGGSDAGGVDEWFGSTTGDDTWHEATTSVIATGSTMSIWYRFRNTTAAGTQDFFGYADDASVVGKTAGATACYTYTAEGTETVTLTVTDSDGDSSTCSLTVTVLDEPLPTCAITFAPFPATTADTVTFNANAAPSPGGTSIVAWDWTFGDGNSGSGDPVTHQYADNGVYTVTLNVTDDAGKMGYCSTTVLVNNVAPTCCISGPSTGSPGVEVCFDDCSTDPDGTIVSQVWDFSGTGTPPTDLVVTNPSFEDASGWTAYDTPGPPNSFGPFCGIGTAGRTGTGLFGDASNWGSIGAGVYQVLADAVPGAEYQATVYIQTRGVPSAANLHCRIGVDPAGGTDPGAATFADNYNEGCPPAWAALSLDFTAASTTPTLFVEYSDDSDQEWNIAAMDDVSVVATGAITGPQACRTYETEGTYTVALIVTDDDGATSTCTHVITIGPATLEVSIPLVDIGWHMISLPLEPVDKNVLLDRASGLVDEESIFYDSYLAGNDPRNRLFRIQPGVGYWTYNPSLYPDQSWYELGVDPPVGKPHPGPWWQGFWLLVDVGHTITYTAYPPTAGADVRFMDITTGPGDWAWMMMGACARIPEPYNADTSTWPTTSMLTDMTWGKSTPPTEPTTWWPTAACPTGGADDAWDLGYIGLPLSGYITGTGYYTVSPSQVGSCGAPANTDSLTPGEGYWMDVEDLEVWLKLLATP